ncbi:MAG: hypothetical protein FWC69_01540 [Defluviitaleaceae bacterium]|nr:hypothetical protein [Defluviitaleaceae bacterium]
MSAITSMALKAKPGLSVLGISFIAILGIASMMAGSFMNRDWYVILSLGPNFGDIFNYIGMALIIISIVIFVLSFLKHTKRI